MPLQPSWIDPHIQQAAQPHFLALSSLDLDNPSDQFRAIQYVQGIGKPVVETLSHKNRMLSRSLLNLMKANALEDTITRDLDTLTGLLEILDPQHVNLKHPGYLDRLLKRTQKYAQNLDQWAPLLEELLDSLKKNTRTLAQDQLSLSMELADLRKQYQLLVPYREVLACLKDTFIPWIEAHPSDQALSFVRQDLVRALEAQYELFGQMELVCLQGMAAMQSLSDSHGLMIQSLKKIEAITMGAFWVSLMLCRRDILSTPSLHRLQELTTQLDRDLQERHDLSFLPDAAQLDQENLERLIGQLESLKETSRQQLSQRPEDISTYLSTVKTL